MKLIDALHILEEFDRGGHTVWSLSGLRIVLPERNDAFRKTLKRLCAAGVLERAHRGVYVFMSTRRDRHVVFGELIGQIRQGEYCYESLESAASLWGIISQTPLGAISVMTTGRSGRANTPFGAIEFVHTDASVNEILENTVTRDGFIPLATKEYVIHGLRRCGRTRELDEAQERGELEELWQ